MEQHSSQQHRRTVRRAALLAVLVVATTFAWVGPSASPASAAPCTTSWASATNGNWSDASKWTAGVPTAASIACITVPGTYAVMLTGSASVGSLRLGGPSGTQSLRIRSECSSSARLTLGSDSVTSGGARIELQDAGSPTCSSDAPVVVQTNGVLRNFGVLAAAFGHRLRPMRLVGNVDNYGVVTISHPSLRFSGGTFAHVAGTVISDGYGGLIVDGRQDEITAYEQGDGRTVPRDNGRAVTVEDGSLVYTGTGPGLVRQQGTTRITGDIAADQLLSVESTCSEGARLIAAESWTNHGSIYLRDERDGCAEWFPPTLDQSGGTFANEGRLVAWGFVDDAARFLFGDITNRGEVGLADAALELRGGTFRHLAGAIVTSTASAHDELRIVDGTYVQGNGRTAGPSREPVVVVRGKLRYAGAGASHVVQTGDSTTITGDISDGQILTVQGQCWEPAVLRADASWTNAGRIELIDATDPACDGPPPSVLRQVGGMLLNKGTMRVASPGRSFMGFASIVGNVHNTGTVRLTNSILEDSGELSNAGLVDLGTSRILQSEGAFVNTATGTVRTEIGQLVAGFIMSATKVKLQGTLDVVTTHVPEPGGGFGVISCTSLCQTGKFTNVQGRSLPGGLAYAVSSEPSGTTLTVKPAADLKVTGSAPRSVSRGSGFSYSFTVTNGGPKPATSVVLTDALPPGVTFRNASPGCKLTAGVVTCPVGRLANGETRRVEIKVGAGDPGVVENTAKVSAATVDLTPGDLSATVSVTIT